MQVTRLIQRDMEEERRKQRDIEIQKIRDAEYKKEQEMKEARKAKKEKKRQLEQENREREEAKKAEEGEDLSQILKTGAAVSASGVMNKTKTAALRQSINS